jgi:replication factor A1
MSELNELVQKIVQKTGQPVEKIFEAIEAKQDELSGLISKEGAAHLVALEYGLNFLEERKRELKIANLVEDLRSVDILAKILDIIGPRDIEKAGKKYKILTVILGDDSGVVQLILWDREIELFVRAGLTKGDWIKLSGIYCKKGRQGIELRLGRGRIEKIEEQNIEIPKHFEKLEIERKQISELKDGDFAEIKAGLVQLFTKNPFFEVCSQCGAKLYNGQCQYHGQTDAIKQPVISGIVDDGSGTIRAVFFRKVAQQIIGEDVQGLFDKLGKEMILKGRVKKNNITNRLEFIVNDVQDVNVKEEIDKHLKLDVNNNYV